MRWTNSIRDNIEHKGVIKNISYQIVFTKESFKTLSENSIVFQVMFMDHKIWVFWGKKVYVHNEQIFCQENAWKLVNERTQGIHYYSRGSYDHEYV